MAALVPVLLFGTATGASAHPTLLSTIPAAGYSVVSAPRMITMVFDEPVTIAPDAIHLEDEAGRAIHTSEAGHEQNGRRVIVSVLDAMPAGRYVVRWELTAQDGDVVAASFDFAVAATTADLHGSQSDSAAGLPSVPFLRWLLFLSLAGILGGLVGERIARKAVPAARQPRSLLRPTAVLGCVAASGLLLHLVRAADDFGRPAYLVAIEAAAFGLLALLGSSTPRLLVAAMGLVVISTEALRNHLGTQRGLSGALVVAIHLIAVCIWMGALAHLLRVARTNAGSISARPAFKAYSRLALMLFLLVAVSGTLGGLILVPSVAALTGGAYGLTLIAKLALVLVVVVLAWLARRRLGRGAFIGTTRLEMLSLVAVLAASATLVSLPPSAPATTDLGYPAPAAGPIIRLGSLAGQIAVGIGASENQLEIRLQVPDGGSLEGGLEPPVFHLTALIGSPGRPDAAVAVQPCGQGCFVGPVSWASGLNRLEVQVDGTGWHGGTVDFPIRWAPQTSRDALTRVRRAMLAQKSFRVVESITSDTTRPTPSPQSVTIDGHEFIDADPYSGPPDPDVVIEARPGGHHLLTFGLPAEGIHVRLEVDPTYRILHETLAAPNHLAQRTFTYSG